jgi:hypothetical protein
MNERVSNEELRRSVTNHQGDSDPDDACDCIECRTRLDLLDARRERDEWRANAESAHRRCGEAESAMQSACIDATNEMARANGAERQLAAANKALRSIYEWLMAGENGEELITNPANWNKLFVKAYNLTRKALGMNAARAVEGEKHECLGRTHRCCRPRGGRG